ncbi:carbamoyl phosphate synthase [Deinococcus piscis]|uniref:Carbamoyl phosphate synthase n=1 Tax=Deinococcus piscis TaxID=394230 RepID=A0ABQ3K7H0_9DEIO|nr:ATP-grasp domain-containing protein [Deinococcus piscis]GHG05385.1 carbamoyl phosphate synthase [Deinococcus piscis]
MNVLVSSAGRRTSLVNLFRTAVQPLGGRVIAADMDPLAPALYLADQAVRVPRVTAPEYIPELLKLVERHAVNLLVPTIDTELPVLAEAQEQFRALGCRVHISSAQFVQITGDKWLTAQEFAEQGIRVPRSWLPEQVSGPLSTAQDLPDKLFLKPRDGSASMHTYSVQRSNLLDMLQQVPNAIVQEEIVGKEITIDAFIGQDGTPVHFVPRARIRTLGGESIQGVTLPGEERLTAFLNTVLVAAAKLGGRGAITLQAFDTGSEYILLEINPRFGGGYPLGHAAGGAYPEWLLQELAGERILPRLGQYEVGLYMTRANTEIFTREPKW